MKRKLLSCVMLIIGIIAYTLHAQSAEKWVKSITQDNITIYHKIVKSNDTEYVLIKAENVGNTSVSFKLSGDVMIAGDSKKKSFKPANNQIIHLKAHETKEGVAGVDSELSYKTAFLVPTHKVEINELKNIQIELL